MEIKEIFLGVWYIFPLILVIAILKSNWWKGLFGEFVVNRLLSTLPTSSYKLIKDVTLPTDDGTTQVDHIVVSRYGIFVVETKNMKGWIFGSSRKKQWTQKLNGKSYQFQNPIHQNYKHIKTLQKILGCNEKDLHSVIVFVGSSTFKNKFPDNVTHSFGSIRYIKRFSKEVFSLDEYMEIIEKISEVKLQRGIVTNIKHKKHVKDIIAKKEKFKVCPSCGSEMIVRKGRKKNSSNGEFWGCSSYPKCKVTQPKDT